MKKVRSPLAVSPEATREHMSFAGWISGSEFLSHPLRHQSCSRLYDTMHRKSILIIDELSFARVCSALLQDAGYYTQTFSVADRFPSAREIRKFSLVITSYPFCDGIIEDIKKLGVSTIILADDIDENLFTVLKDFNNSHCMMKPLDYERFRSLVKKLMGHTKTTRGGSYYFA